jgi:hypothetical protein
MLHCTDYLADGSEADHPCHERRCRLYGVYSEMDYADIRLVGGARGAGEFDIFYVVDWRVQQFRFC